MKVTNPQVVYGQEDFDPLEFNLRTYACLYLKIRWP